MTRPDLHPDFREFLSCLSAHRVRYVVVGAHALAVLGAARFTTDLDVLVEPTVSNAKRLGKAFAAFGFAELGREAVEHFSAPERIATIGRKPLQIDVLSSIARVSFGAAWKGRVTVSLGRQRVPFLGRTEMKRVKRAVGRTKDLLDLALLEEVEPKPARRKSKVSSTLRTRK